MASQQLETDATTARSSAGDAPAPHTTWSQAQDPHTAVRPWPVRVVPRGADWPAADDVT
ncbi:MAG: hypothetical protein FWE61_06440 [Micrococcales bacterium]|nr:hypothetical protein [Micrococcales bacterium]